MKEVFLLLILHCSGHTNAQCYPEIYQFETLEQCEKARTLPEERTYFGFHIEPARKNKSAVCFKSVR